MQAIVLYRRDFREMDQVISVYTREHGKRELLIRGVKKITSKNAAHLEPIALVQIEVARGKEMDHITTVQAIEFFSSIRSTLAKSIMATVIVDMVNHLVGNNQTDPALFALLHGSLQTLEKAARISPWFVDAFALRCMAKLGFASTLDRCVVCGVKEASSWSLTVMLGGKICASCRPKKERAGAVFMDCTVVVLSALEDLLIGNDLMEIDHKSESQLHEFVYKFLLFHSEKKIADWARVVSL